MRTLIFGICIALAAIAALLLITPGSGIIGDKAGHWSATFGKPVIATFGGQQAAVFFSEGENADGIAWVAQASPEPFIQTVYWEAGEAAGAGNREQVKNALNERLSVAGLETQGRAGAFPPGGQFAVVAVSGAMPKKITDAILDGSFPKNGQMLIYVGLADGSQIGEDGKISSNQNLAGALKHGVENADGSAESVAAAGGKIIIFPKVPDEYEGGTLAGKIARQILLSKNTVQTEATVKLAEGDGAVALPVPFNKSYFRVAAMRQNEILKLAFFGPEYALPGEISGGEEAAEGAVYRISSDLGNAKNQELEMYVVVHGKEMDEAWKKQVGNANASQRFVGAAKIERWPTSRWAIFVLEDQYGRKFARGFALIPQLEARLTYDGGREKEFLLLKNGEPLTGSTVRVRKLGGAWSEVQLSEGKAIISSKWNAGENTVEFESNGAKAEQRFRENGGQVVFYIKWGVPGLVLAAILIFALIPKEQKKYTVRYGGAKSYEHGKFRMGAQDLAARISRAQSGLGLGALTEREINRQLFAQTGVLASDGTMKNALRALVKNGLLAEYGGYFAAVKKGGVGKVRENTLLRRLSDSLLQQGISAVEKNGAHFAGKGKNARAWIFDGENAPQSLKKFPAVMLVFESREEGEKWRRSLSFRSREDSEIALALKTGKLGTFVLPK